MTIQLTLNFATAVEAVEFLTKLHPEATPVIDLPEPEAPKRSRQRKSGAQPEVATNTGSSVSPAEPATSQATSEDAPLSSSEGATVVDATPATAVVTNAAQADAEAGVVSNVTLEEVRAALGDFIKANNIEVGSAKLRAMGAARISDLKPEQYAAFIASLKA